MRTLLLLAALGPSLLVAKPNILLIYSDDQGWADLGAQGVDAHIRTPNLDQLARDGIRFTRGYVCAPQCVPSRAGVLTGRYQQRFGLEDNTKGALPLEERTIAERLKPAGYVTGHAGKWHLDLQGEGKSKRNRGPIPAHMPHGQGFDEYWRGERARFFASHNLKGEPFADAPRLVTDNRFRVTVQTEAAMSFLNRREARPEQPWFLYLAYYTPHVPLESPEPWFSKTAADLPKERRQALAMIAAMDEGVGTIRKRIREMGQEQNTLIFFISDNGAPIKSGHWDGSINKPLVGEKGMLTDGGIRVPFLAAWPGRLPAGVVYEQPVINLDVAATAVALAGLPHDESLDGVNLLPFLTGENKAPPHEALFWRWRSQAAVLEMPWKLIRLGPDEQFLFDVTTPEGETKNLIAQRPEIAARLNARLRHWAAGLKPPGLPAGTNDQDRLFFAEHVDPPFAPAPRKTVAPAAGIQGWLCRNGGIAVQEGALAITPDAAAKGPPFLANSSLDLVGPLSVTIRARALAGGEATLAWRTRHESDFDPRNRAAFVWPMDTAWRDVAVNIPATQRVVHLRIHTPRNGSGMAIQSIAVSRPGHEARTWDFTRATTSTP